MATTVTIFKSDLLLNDVGLSQNLIESKWKPFRSRTGIFFPYRIEIKKKKKKMSGFPNISEKSWKIILHNFLAEQVAQKSK